MRPLYFLMSFIVYLTMITYQVNAQTIFQTTISNGVYMCGNDIKEKDGFFYICGTAKQPGISYVLLMKTDNSGDTIWTYYFLFTLPAEGKRILISNNDIYLTGNLDPGLSSSKVFIAKTDEAGTVKWCKVIEGSGRYEISDAIMKDDTTIVLVGNVSGSGSGGKDILLTKFDTAGNLLSSKCYGTPGNEEGSSIIPSDNGGYYITGDVDYNDPNGDIFIQHISSSGSALWCKTYNTIVSGFSGQNAYDLIENSFHQLVVAGNTKEFEFAPGDEVWPPMIMKTDSSGNVIYAGHYDLNSGGGAAFQVIETNDHNFVYTGYMKLCYSLLVKTTELGTTQWSYIYGTSSIGSGGYLSKGFSLIQYGSGFVMTGFLVTSYDTSLYLVRTNPLGETNCYQTVPPINADYTVDTPIINNLVLTSTEPSLTLNDYFPSVYQGAPSIYVLCNTPTPVAGNEPDQCSLYPNPVKDILQIKGNLSSFTFRLYDEYGKLLETGTRDAIDFRRYDPGLYFLTIVSKGNVYTNKVVKVR